MQAVLIPAWIAYRINIRQSKLRAVLANGGIALLRLGFICFSVAALAEMLDHAETDWIYINRLSVWNGLFYAGLAGGLASLSAAVTAKRILRIIFYMISVAVVIAYPLFGKGVVISFQSILTVIFLAQWWKHFRDPLLWVYPMCGVTLSTVFGAMLSTSGDQIWHVFIGPVGSASLITLWIVLNRAVSEKISMNRPC